MKLAKNFIPQSCNRVKITRKIPGLPYKVGDKVPVTFRWDGLPVWHVWKHIIVLPEGSYEGKYEEVSDEVS